MKKFLYILFAWATIFTVQVFSQNFEVVSSSSYTDLNPSALGQNYSILVSFSYNLDVNLPTDEYPGMSFNFQYEWNVDGADVTNQYMNMPTITLSSYPNQPLHAIGDHFVKLYIIGTFDWINNQGQNERLTLRRYVGQKIVTTYEYTSIDRKTGEPYYVDRKMESGCGVPYNYAVTQEELVITTFPSGYGSLFDVFVYHPLGTGTVNKPNAEENSFIYISPVESQYIYALYLIV